MLRLPPRSTRTTTLLPYTTLCRSWRMDTLLPRLVLLPAGYGTSRAPSSGPRCQHARPARHQTAPPQPPFGRRSEEQTSELPSLMRISDAVFCLKKKTHTSELKSHMRTAYAVVSYKTYRHNEQ